ncbi:hypothetical protein B0H19DRAFT_1069381 [Mycena capillaripes]|nr:hypothetical protein B0H19DRAFT_1069381 [Mycena capillaripes]
MLSRKRRSKAESTKNPPEKSRRKQDCKETHQTSQFTSRPRFARQMDRLLLNSALPITAVGPRTSRPRGEGQHGEMREEGGATGGGGEGEREREREKNVTDDKVGGTIRRLTEISTCDCPHAGPIARRAIHPSIHPLRHGGKPEPTGPSARVAAHGVQGESDTSSRDEGQDALRGSAP